MNNMKKEKILALSILILFMVSLLAGVVSAIEWKDVSGAGDFFKWLQEKALSSISPIGFEETAAGIAIGIIAMIMIFVIMLDVFQLVLPFSDWVSYILAIGFVIAGAILGMVRTVAGWGMLIGAYIAGGAGAFALVMTAIVFLFAIIFLFFGGQWIQKWIIKMKARRYGLELTKKQLKSAAQIRALKTLAKEATEEPLA